MTTTRDYVRPAYRLELERMTARELWHELRRSEGPADVVDAIAQELEKRRAGAGGINRDRAAAYFRAEYHAWAARKRFPATGHDPGSGRDWPAFGTLGELGRDMERASNAAAARVAYRHARAFPSPFAHLEEVRNALLQV